MKKILALLLAAVLMLSVFAGCSTTPTEASPYAKSAFKVGDTEYSIAEYNYMYMNSFKKIYSSLYSNYASYISYIIDISKPLEEQDYSEGVTWDDYITDYTEETLRRMTVVNEAANADGDYVLSDYYKNALDNLDSDLAANAESYGMTVEEFVKYVYGETVDVETFKDMTQRQYVYYDYAEKYETSVEVTYEELKELYESDVNSYDTVDFRYFAIPYTDDETTEFTEEQKAAAVEKANAMAAVKTAEEFDALALENAPEANREYYETENATLYRGVQYADLNIGDVADWLFDSARTAGETYVSENDGSACVFIFFFEERVPFDYSTINVRHILIAPEADEEGNSDDAAWSAAEAKAQEIYDGFLAGEHTEEIFSQLAEENSSDAGSKTNGGLYENVAKGRMVKEFEDWCYDDTREIGDSGIIRSAHGYHIMYFVGEGENNLNAELYETVANEKYEAWIAELSEGVETSELDDYASVGKFVDDVVAVCQAHAAAELEGTPTDGTPTDGTESTESTESTSTEGTTTDSTAE